jgi:hypothetical protein
MNEQAGTTGSAGMDEVAGTSIVQLNWPLAGLGVWLLAVVAAGGYAGPAGVWGVNALGAGLAYLLMAVIEPRLRRA